MPDRDVDRKARVTDGGSEAPGITVVTFRSRETTQNATYELLEILRELTRVSLITANLASESPIHDEFEVTQISGKGTSTKTIITAAIRFLLNQLRMCLAIAKRDEEVILFFGATAYLIPIFFARLIGRTVILEPRGDVPLTLQLQWDRQVPTLVASFLAGLVRLLQRINFWFASAIITYTPAMAEQLGLSPHATKLHSTGARHVHVDEFTVETTYAERQQQIGYIGRLDVEKGIETLAAVVKQLPEPTRFVFVGDGDYRDWLESELADEIANNRAQVTGWVDHDRVVTHLNRLRLLVMPSEPTEGLPSTILEAFACGTPVFATPVAGIPDVVREGETGFLMTSTDPREIAERVQTILGRDDLEEISSTGRQLVEDEYSFEATVERYRMILNDITSGVQ
jgi:glycosyltransferase involved in cell wall biosynthesis